MLQTPYLQSHIIVRLLLESISFFEIKMTSTWSKVNLDQYWLKLKLDLVSSLAKVFFIHYYATGCVKYNIVLNCMDLQTYMYSVVLYHILLCLSEALVFEPTISSNTIDCNQNGDLTANDTTSGGGGSTVYCRTAGYCEIQCTGNWCLDSAVIHAEDSLDLNILGNAYSCFGDADIYLPNGGNTTIIADARSISYVFHKVQIFAGSADHIFIKCYDDDSSVLTQCKGLQVYASNATYLELIVYKASIQDFTTQETIIYCPENSDYCGSALSSCIINVTQAVSTNGMEIYALNGYPDDVIFYGGGSGDYSGTVIKCNDGALISYIDSNGTFASDNSSDCWNPVSTPKCLPSTTSDPTFIPTSNPIIIPTIIPTKNPSNEPSNEPTNEPILSPTFNPSSNPTIDSNIVSYV